MITLYGIKFAVSGSLLLEKVSDNSAAIVCFRTKEMAEEYLRESIDAGYRQLLQLTEVDWELIEKTKVNNNEIPRLLADLRL